MVGFAIRRSPCCLYQENVLYLPHIKKTLDMTPEERKKPGRPKKEKQDI